MQDAGTKTGWTPGRWEVVSKFVGPLEVHADGLKVAEVGHEDFGVCAANARLIAAAPELYEQLARAVECIEFMRKRMPRSLQDGEGIPAEVFMRAALAKARGEQ